MRDFADPPVVKNPPLRAYSPPPPALSPSYLGPLPSNSKLLAERGLTTLVVCAAASSLLPAVS